MTAIYDEDGRFHGHVEQIRDQHRTVGSHRAWSDWSMWCYPMNPCVGCEEWMRNTIPCPRCQGRSYLNKSDIIVGGL